MTESSFERKVLRLALANLVITVAVSICLGMALFSQRAGVKAEVQKFHAEAKRFDDFRVERMKDHEEIDRRLGELDRLMEQFNRARIRMEEGYHAYIEQTGKEAK